jgi:hypothetical protein
VELNFPPLECAVDSIKCKWCVTVESTPWNAFQLPPFSQCCALVEARCYISPMERSTLKVTKVFSQNYVCELPD